MSVSVCVGLWLMKTLRPLRPLCLPAYFCGVLARQFLWRGEKFSAMSNVKTWHYFSTGVENWRNFI